jgi:competence ComEA-like helix-hairpin-helix protein
VVRLPDFLQFTPDERRAALALLLFTGGGGLLLEIGKRHPEWMPDLVAVRRRVETTAPAEVPPRSPEDSALSSHPAVAGLLPASAGGEIPPGAEGSDTVKLEAPADSTGGKGSASSSPRRHASSRKTDPAAPVDVNTADLATLMTLPGIGPALAQRIVDDRAQNGPYRSVEDMARVKGIGKRAVERLRPVVRTN